MAVAMYKSIFVVMFPPQATAGQGQPASTPPPLAVTGPSAGQKSRHQTPTTATHRSAQMQQLAQQQQQQGSPPIDVSHLSSANHVKAKPLQSMEEVDKTLRDPTRLATLAATAVMQIVSSAVNVDHIEPDTDLEELRAKLGDGASTLVTLTYDDTVRAIKWCLDATAFDYHDSPTQTPVPLPPVAPPTFRSTDGGTTTFVAAATAATAAATSQQQQQQQAVFTNICKNCGKQYMHVVLLQSTIRRGILYYIDLRRTYHN